MRLAIWLAQYLMLARRRDLRRRITRKKEGEVTELQFMARAATMRFTVAKPHGDSEAYDVLVDNGRRCWRMQGEGRRDRFARIPYVVNCRHRRFVNGRHLEFQYRKGEVDFLRFCLPRKTPGTSCHLQICGAE